MKTSCPFCRQAYDIETEHLDRKIECSACKRTFSCSIVAIPLVGSMYLDVETTASPEKSYAEISSIVWWCNQEWHSWVNGRDDAKLFLLYWRHAPEIITFNGKAFDEPKICNQFKVSTPLAWRFINLSPRIEGNLQSVTDCQDFCDFVDYLVLRRDKESCGANELGGLALLSVAFPREIEKRIQPSQERSKPKADRSE